MRRQLARPKAVSDPARTLRLRWQRAGIELAGLGPVEPARLSKTYNEWGSPQPDPGPCRA